MILLWQNSRLPRRQSMRVALLGAGTIARLVLEHVRGGEFQGVEIVALAGRNGSSCGRALAREFGVSYVAGRAALVGALGVDRDRLQSAHTLFEGPAREGVPHFPQNVNIAAVLSLAGIGWDRTRLIVVADPALTLNTHTIRVAGASGRFSVVLENVPAPENPRTSWLACYSALAALRSIQSRVR